jgi:hypothetical protein
MTWWSKWVLRKSGMVVAGLVLLAAVQVGAIVATVRRAPAPVRLPDLAMGARIRAVPGRDSLGRPFSLAFPRPVPEWTVLLAFSPECAWCDSVAPRWKRWSERVTGRLKVVALTAAEPPAALGYVHSHQWQVHVLLTVDSARTGDLARQLTRKTPWFFLIDRTGALRFSGHGNDIGLVDSIVTASVLP